MRGVWLVLLLVPLVAAQSAPAVELLTVSIDPFEGLVQPFQSAITTTVHVHASCALADPVAGVVFSYIVKEQPAWSTVVVSPATDVRGPETCDTGWHDVEAILTVTASDQAPAFLPTPIVVEVTAGSGQRAQSAVAGVNVSASYFAILDVQLAETQVTMAPGSSRDLIVKVTNFGNGRTRVETLLGSPAEGFTVTAPAPRVLGSKQAGGNDISAELVFHVSAAPAGGFVNRVGLINARIVSAYEEDDSFPGDEVTMSFLVTVRSGVDDEGVRNTVGSPALLALGSLGIAGAFVLARGRRR